MRSFFSPKLKILLAMLIWGSLGIFVTGIPLPSTHIVLARAFFGCLLLLPLVLRQKGRDKAALQKALPGLLLLGAMIGVNWVLLFEAYRYTYVSIATLCYYLQPVFLILLGRVLLREPINGRKWLGIAVALAGMVLMNGLSAGGSDPARGVLLALGAAVLYALIIALNKRMPQIKAVDSMTLTLVELFAAGLAVGLYVAVRYQGEYAGLSAKSWLLLCILGFVHTGLAYWLYFSSIAEIPASSLAVYGYVDPLSALLFSALFLSERLSPVQWLGAALILGGALISEGVRLFKETKHEKL